MTTLRKIFFDHNPEHRIVGFLAAVITGAVLYTNEVHGLMLGLIGAALFGWAILISRADPGSGCWLVLAVAVAEVIVSRLDNPIAKSFVWWVTSIGAGLLTANALFEASEFTKRAGIALLSLALVLSAGVLVTLLLRSVFPAIEWIVYIAGGPFFAAIFAQITKSRNPQIYTDIHTT